MPFGTGTPNSRSTALAWYSWMFMRCPTSAVMPREGGASSSRQRSLTHGATAIPDRLPVTALALPFAGDDSSSYRFPRSGAIFWQASTRPFTAPTDLSNSRAPAPLSSSSTMRSTPLAPITTGTPT